MQLAQPAKAVTVFEREISNLPVTDRVDAGLYRARLARAYLMDDHPDDAARTALTASEMANATGSWRAQLELAQVRKLIGRRPVTAAVARFAAIYDASAHTAGPADGRS
jgi:hypothetical protein